MRDYWQKTYNIDVNSPVIGVIEPKLVSKEFCLSFLPVILRLEKLLKKAVAIFENHNLDRYQRIQVLGLDLIVI